MKKEYVKPAFDTLCFEVEDVIAASGDPQGELDSVGNSFETNTDGLLDFFKNPGNGI